MVWSKYSLYSQSEWLKITNLSSFWKTHFEAETKYLRHTKEMVNF